MGEVLVTNKTALTGWIYSIWCFNTRPHLIWWCVTGADTTSLNSRELRLSREQRAMIAFSSALHWDNASSCRVTKLPSLSVCVCVCFAVLYGHTRWGIYCRDSVRSHWWEYHTHTRARARTHTEMVNRLQRRYVHKHCLMHPSGSEGWRIIRPEKQFNKVGLFWMCSITSCHLFFYWLNVSTCEHVWGASGDKKNAS